MAFKVKRNFLLFLILSVPLSVLVGGRGGTSDTQVYYDVFANIGDYDLTNPFLFYKESGMEIGFGWYSFIIGHFTSSPFVLFFIFSFLNFIFIFKTAQLLGVNFFYVFLVYVSSSYFFLQQFMQMRQGLAISIAFYCFVYMLRCKVNFLVLLLLVMSFFLHQSTLFITSFYLFYVFLRRIDFFCLTRHINPIYIVTTISLVLILVFKFVFLSFLIYMSGRLQDYANTSQYSGEIGYFSLPNIKLLLTICIFFILLNRKLQFDSCLLFLTFMCFIAFSVRIGFSEMAIMSGRLSTAFSYAEIFLIPALFEARFSRLVGFSCIVILFLIQLTITIGYQAPYLINDYFNPLYVYS